MAARFPVTSGLARAVCVGAFALCVAGCTGAGDLSNTDTGRMGALLFHAIAGIGSSDAVPRARVAAVPYASLGVRLGSSDESLFVLASKSGDNLVWLGGPRLAITTRNGRVVRTAGFEHNLTGFQVASMQAAADGENYLYDFSDRSRYGVAVKCLRQNLGAERIVIVGVPHDTSHLVEDCAAPELDWRFRDEFWRDASGFVWKSEQYAAPGLDRFTLEILRPAE
ncbi:MAG TPA: YjbF family lipoprotein [Rhizomicrobium sp.]